MARIVGGIGSSRAPSMVRAWDGGLQKDPQWVPLFDGYIPAQRWLDTRRPDLLVIFYNDHMNHFFFDAFPTLALGVGDLHPQADEGWGKRNLPDLRGHPEFAWHLARSLMENEFNPTICQEMALDRGILSVLPVLGANAMATPVVPIAVNVIRHPLPTARRLYRLGAAVRRAVESFPRDLRVMVLGTGGLSHQLHGERFDFVHEARDNDFMDLLETQPETLAALHHQEWMLRGGTEGVEMIIWPAMRSAPGDKVRRVHRNYAAPAHTGYGLLALAPA